MPQVTPLSPELTRSVSAVARSLVTAARTWSLYPPEHPAVQTSLERFSRTIEEACRHHVFTFGVTPDTLLLQGAPAARSEGAIAEAAAWLHQRDILQLTFRTNTPAAALEAFLALLAQDPVAVRERGGPAVAWERQGHTAILIEQIDFAKVLEDGGDTPDQRRDDIWRSIVRAILDRRKTLDEASQTRMLEIAGDVGAIGDLAQDVMAPHCTPDGSPLLTTQAAAVVAAYRHLVSIVDVMAPERRAEVLQNLAAATAVLDPHVVMQILGATADAGAGPLGDGLDLRRAVADAMDDSQVAQLLATTLAIDGQATERLASVFGTIAPDDERRRRVLTMTRNMLTESSFGKTNEFQTLWTSMEELLLSYNERPFVSTEYRDAMDQVGVRAERMGAAGIPPELAALIGTLDEDNVRRLSVALLIDLLSLERDPARAPELARDVGALGEDLLLAGDYGGARDVAVALAGYAASPTSIAAGGARVALDALVNTAAFHETVDYLGDMDDPTAAVFAQICEAVGPASTEALREGLDVEERTKARVRATSLIRTFGSRAAGRLAPLISSPHWYAQRNAAELLGGIASAEAVPLLQPLLRGSDPRVTQAAVRALSNIDDPSAARAVHTVLRAATGELRQAVVSALVAERDPRVVPLLARILDESDPFGVDHAIVIESLGAVGVIGGDHAIPSIDRAMRRTKWFARQKMGAIKTAAVRALQQIGTPAAKATLAAAAATGDRALKRAASIGAGA